MLLIRLNLSIGHSVMSNFGYNTMMLIQHSVNSDWLFNTQSRVLQADWLMLEYKEKATLNILMPYPCTPKKESSIVLSYRA